MVKAMPALSVKTRRAPFRHCKDARVYGQTTMAMHDVSTPPYPSAQTLVFRRLDKAGSKTAYKRVNVSITTKTNRA